MMSHSCIAVLYLYMTTSSLSVNYIFRMFALLFHSFVVVERINVPMWIHTTSSPPPHAMHEEHRIKQEERPISLNATGSQQLGAVFLNDHLQWHRFTVGWFCRLEGTRDRAVAAAPCACVRVCRFFSSCWTVNLLTVSGCLFLTTAKLTKE